MNNSELFLDYLTRHCGQEEQILQEPAADGGRPIFVFVYQNFPEPGRITGITFGLSAREYKGWTVSRPEMVISMESKSLSWPSAALGLTAYFAGKKRFRYGDVFTVDGPLAEDTSMDATLIFAQSILAPELATVQLRDYRVTLSQFYPFYRSEIPLYDRLGLEFWKHPQFDKYNPKRQSIEPEPTKLNVEESAGVVHCGTHGDQMPTFVCQHLVDGSGLGFVEPTGPRVSDTDYNEQAWCDECERIRARQNGWDDVSEGFAAIKMICGECFKAARLKNQR